VLERVIGRVSDVGLGIDDEPRLPFGGEHIAGVEVRGQQYFSFRGRRERPEEGDAFTPQTRIKTGAGA
jgi:hypothetical protein